MKKIVPFLFLLLISCVQNRIVQTNTQKPEIKLLSFEEIKVGKKQNTLMMYTIPEEKNIYQYLLSSPESQAQLAKLGIALPSRKSVIDSDIYLKNPVLLKNQPHLEKKSIADDPFVKQLEYGVFDPISYDFEKIRGDIDYALDDVFSGNTDAKEALIWLTRREPQN